MGQDAGYRMQDTGRGTPDALANEPGALDTRELRADAQRGLMLMREFAPGPTLTAEDVEMLRALSALVMTNAVNLHYPPDAPPTFGEVVGRVIAAAFQMGKARREIGE